MGPTPPTHPRFGVVPERILCYGPEGSGKSRNILSIARWHQDRGSDAVFRVLDTDFAYKRMLIGEFSDLENIEVFEADAWPDYPRLAKKIRDTNRPEDWMVVDLASTPWSVVQDHYIERVFDTDLSDYWEAARKQGKTKDGTPLDGWQDWGIINKMYRDFEQWIHRAHCHVYATAGARQLVQSRGSVNEAADVVRDYGRIGFKPEGQKGLGHLFHTVLYCQAGPRGTWFVTTAKDRERKTCAGVQLGEFSIQYLLKVARWKP